MEPTKDQVSGRHIIEGRGVPIEGGIFVGGDRVRTVVDSDITKQPRLNKVMKEAGKFLTKEQDAILGVIPALAREHLPVNQTRYEEMINQPNKLDRYQLQLFLTHKNEEGVELGGGGPDQQALLAALMLEKYYKDKYRFDIKTRISGTMPTIAVTKDAVDRHARVLVMTRKGRMYEFDPKRGDTKFKNI